MKKQKDYWFKAKPYGWGWYPANGKGWIVLFVYILLVSGTAYRVDAGSHSVSDTLLGVVPETVLLTILLIGICWITGEKPRWRWGK